MKTVYSGHGYYWDGWLLTGV